MVWVCVCQIYFPNSMNYTELSVTCLDPFHHIYTVHYLSLKPPKIKFTSNISSWSCHWWFTAWFYWRLDYYFSQTVYFIYNPACIPITGFWNEKKKGNVFWMYSIIYTKNRIPECGMQKTKTQRRERIKSLFICIIKQLFHEIDS